MDDVLALFISLLFFGEEVNEVMAMLWVNQIMMGKKNFSDVPARLKDQVRELLIDNGCEDLVTED